MDTYKHNNFWLPKKKSCSTPEKPKRKKTVNMPKKKWSLVIYSEMGLLLTDWLYWEHKITDREVACAFKCFESPLASALVNMSGSFGIITFKYDFRADNYLETVLSLSHAIVMCCDYCQRVKLTSESMWVQKPNQITLNWIKSYTCKWVNEKHLLLIEKQIWANEKYRMKNWLAE